MKKAVTRKGENYDLSHLWFEKSHNWRRVSKEGITPLHRNAQLEMSSRCSNSSVRGPPIREGIALITT